MQQNTLQGLRILLVEDEALIAILLEDMLADLGCVVVAVATSLAAAQKRAASDAFDAALLDVNLNGADSFPVAFELKSRSIPFLFSTGYGGKGLPQALRRSPVLVKPFESADLKRGLLEMLRGYRA